MSIHGVSFGNQHTNSSANPAQQRQPYGFEGKYFAGSSHHNGSDTIHFGAQLREPIFTSLWGSPNGLFRKSPEQKYFKAIQKNDRAGVDAYLKNGGNINYQDKNGTSGLMSATQPDMIRYLVNKGADKNLRDTSRNTALHLVVDSNRAYTPQVRKELAQLLATPQNINWQSNYLNETALYTSIKNGFNETSLALIDAGAKATIAAKDNMTTLMQASWNDQGSVADALIRSVAEGKERGDFVNATNKWGRTAQDMARTFKKADAIKVLVGHMARNYKDESTIAAEEAAARAAEEAAALAAEGDTPAATEETPEA